MIFPFTAIVGQDDLKRALILNIIDPGIGGLLIIGEKGTAKSTAVRALAELLPEVEMVADCRFFCDPAGPLCPHCQGHDVLHAATKKMKVVELPLGVSEDRLVGTLDIEYAIKHGEKKFEAGLLADANRNFFYIDEVNLLEDHIIDLLLDSAAMGINTVEREGMSFTHPSRFILVGSMNPEEGDLRPQLLDRFGLSVRVSGLRDKNQRLEILKRKAAFDDDPNGFAKLWADEQKKTAEVIESARQRLKSIELADDILEKIVALTSSLRLDGHRADIVIMKASRALTALDGLSCVSLRQIKEAALLALGHRRKTHPFEDQESGRKNLETAIEECLA